MFAQSYDPFGCDRRLHYNNLSSPRTRQIRKRRENARRRRMIDAGRRRQAESERMLRTEEKLKMEEQWHQVEAMIYQLELEEALRQLQLSTESSRPPLPLSVRISSQDESEDNSPSPDSATHPSRMTVLEPGGKAAAPTQKRKPNARSRADAELSSTCTDEHRPDANDMDGDEAPVPPHVIAIEDVSDDEEDEDLDSLFG